MIASDNDSLGTEQVDLLERFYLQTNFNKVYRRYPIVIYPGYHQRRAGCFSAGNRYMYIDSKGDIHACPFCQGAAGNVLNDSLNDVVKKLRVTGCHEYSFYDKETTGQDDTGKGIPKTTVEMMKQGTFETWDFTNIWRINEENSYPYLWWQE